MECNENHVWGPCGPSYEHICKTRVSAEERSFWVPTIVQKSAENKMNLENLSTCFAVNLIDSKGAVDLKEAEVLTNNAKLFLMRMIADYND